MVFSWLNQTEWLWVFAHFKTYSGLWNQLRTSEFVRCQTRLLKSGVCQTCADVLKIIFLSHPSSVISICPHPAVSQLFYLEAISHLGVQLEREIIKSRTSWVFLFLRGTQQLRCFLLREYVPSIACLLVEKGLISCALSRIVSESCDCNLLSPTLWLLANQPLLFFWLAMETICLDHHTQKKQWVI